MKKFNNPLLEEAFQNAENHIGRIFNNITAYDMAHAYVPSTHSM